MNLMYLIRPVRELRVFTSKDSEENGFFGSPSTPSPPPSLPLGEGSSRRGRRGEWLSAPGWGSFFAAVSEILQVSGSSQSSGSFQSSGSIQSSGLFQVSGKMIFDRSRNIHSNIQVQI